MKCFFVAAVLWLFGCSPSDNEAGGGRTDEFNAALARVICEQNLACCAVPETTLELCRARVENHFQALRASRNASLETFDASLARDCLDRMAAMSCEGWAAEIVEANPPAACRNYARGKLADGRACGSDLECRSHFCNANTGACEARLGQDAPCDGLNNQCTAGMSCGQGSMPGAFCGAPAIQGAACGSGPDCYSATCSGRICSPSCWYDPVRYDAF